MSRIASATEFKSFCSRSNCSESRRFRSTISPCNLRSPEICTVMYAEYATTAASVMISPNKSARVGDLCSSDRLVPRWFEPVFSTPKEYPRAPIDMECGASAPPLQRHTHHHTRRSPRWLARLFIMRTVVYESARSQHLQSPFAQNRHQHNHHANPCKRHQKSDRQTICPGRNESHQPRNSRPAERRHRKNNATQPARRRPVPLREPRDVDRINRRAAQSRNRESGNRDVRTTRDDHDHSPDDRQRKRRDHEFQRSDPVQQHRRESAADHHAGVKKQRRHRRELGRVTQKSLHMLRGPSADACFASDIQEKQRRNDDRGCNRRNSGAALSGFRGIVVLTLRQRNKHKSRGERESDDCEHPQKCCQ